MYRVIKFFTDLQDNNHAYKVGDVFPHDGMKVSEIRLKELSTDANRRHMPLIEKVEVEPVQIEPTEAEEEPVENRAEVAQEEEPVEGFMNPPEEADETPEEKPVDDSEDKEDALKPKKKRGRPRNDAE